MKSTKKKQYYGYSRLLENIYSFNVLLIFITFPDLENTFKIRFRHIFRFFQCELWFKEKKNISCFACLIMLIHVENFEKHCFRCLPSI